MTAINKDPFLQISN